MPTEFEKREKLKPSHFHHSGGEMASIRQLKSGRWQAQVRRVGERPLSKTFQARQQAAQWARKAESEMDIGGFQDLVSSGQITIAELIERYAQEVTPNKRSAKNEIAVLKGLSKHFGCRMLLSLRSRHIAEYRDMRLVQVAGATVIKEMNTLSHVVDTAIKDWGYGLPQNPVKLVRKPKAARGRDRRLGEGEEERILSACQQSRSHLLLPIVVLALETGMRLGELLSLTWDLVDINSRVASLPITKNGEPRRVPLSTRAIATLQLIPCHITAPKVFWCWKGSDSFGNAWRRAMLKAQVGDLRFHDLRHEATSRFFELGFNTMEVATITGHKTLQMLKRYTHLRAETLAQRLG
jgi:integrase